MKVWSNPVTEQEAILDATASPYTVPSNGRLVPWQLTVLLKVV